MRNSLDKKVRSCKGKYSVFKLNKREKKDLDQMQVKCMREKWGDVLYIPGGKSDSKLFQALTLIGFAVSKHRANLNRKQKRHMMRRTLTTKVFVG